MKAKSIRIFGITFFLSLTILFSVGAILLLIAPQEPKAAVVSSELSKYQPDAEDNLTVLAIGKQENENNALYFTLIRFDAKNAVLTLAGLPVETEISIGTKTKTLNRYYQQSGPAGAVNAVRQALRVSVDRYAVLTENSIIMFADSLGGVEFYVEHDMKNEHVDIRAGKQLIDGRRYRDMILFDPEFRTDLFLTKSLLEQRIGLISEKQAKELFDELIVNMDTNISYYDFESRKRAFKYWTEINDEKVKIFEFEGDYRSDRKAFSLSEDSVAAYRTEIFGMITN